MVALSLKSKASKGLAAVALAAVAGILATPSQAVTPEETFNSFKVIVVPNLASFDISWADPVSAYYFLADRSNAAIDFTIVNNYTISGVSDGFVGVALTSTGTVNNDLSGPNGVLTFNNTVSGQNEIWVGDGPQANALCPSYLAKCSVVKVLSFSGGSAVPTHSIPTFGAARADELCSDPVDHLVVVANDAEADFKFGTPFISFISTDTYQIVKQVTIPQATNGIEQCKWDKTTGLIFINIPEVNGPGNDTADGHVYVFSPTTFAQVADYTIDITASRCAGPQGMAVGPEPQLLLGCNAPDKSGLRNSLIINKHTGATFAIAWGLGGADEVWFNPSDSHYAITQSTVTAPAPRSVSIVDGTGALGVDQIITLQAMTGPFGVVSPHSVAIDPFLNQVFSPNFGEIDVFQNSGNDSDDVASPQLSN